MRENAQGSDLVALQERAGTHKVWASRDLMLWSAAAAATAAAATAAAAACGSCRSCWINTCVSRCVLHNVEPPFGAIGQSWVAPDSASASLGVQLRSEHELWQQPDCSAPH